MRANSRLPWFSAHAPASVRYAVGAESQAQGAAVARQPHASERGQSIAKVRVFIAACTGLQRESSSKQ
jgi:hypothetical protein